MGDGDTSSALIVNLTNTVHRILKTKDIALQLADSRVAQAQQEALIAQLKQQMAELQQLNITAESEPQQGAPHLSGSAFFKGGHLKQICKTNTDRSTEGHRSSTTP